MKPYFTRKFKKNYQRCPEKIKDQFKKRLALFLENPHHPLLENHTLHGEWDGYRSINITGDYRALYKYRIDGAALFSYLDTHSNLYE